MFNSISRSLFFLLFVFSFAVSKAQTLSWVTQFKGAGEKRINLGAGAVDSAGNIYTVGTFEDTLDFDPGPGALNYHTDYLFQTDIFITKQSPDGGLLWAHHFGATQIGDAEDAATDIAIGPSGDIYIIGYFDETIDFDPGPGTATLTSSGIAGIHNMFVLRLKSNGQFVWVKQLAGHANTDYDFITVDSNENVIIGVNYAGTLDFDPGPGIFNIATAPTSPGNGANYDFVICKLNSSGSFVWARHFGEDIDNQLIFSIKTDNNNNIAFAGMSASNMDYDPGPGVFIFPSLSYPESFIVQLNPSGDFMWATEISDISILTDMVRDNSGNYFTIGYETPFKNTYITKLSSNGNVIWSKEIHNDDYISGDVFGFSIVASENDIYITASLRGKADFDPGPDSFYLNSGSGDDVAIAQYTKDGELVWAKNIGGNVSLAPSFILIDSFENVVIGGQFGGVVDFDPGPDVFIMNSLKINSHGDLFVARYSKSNLITGKTFKDNNGDGIQQVLEPRLPNVIIKGTRGNLNYFGISDSNGVYRIFADTGTYLITPSLPQYYISVSPANRSVAFGSLVGQLDTTNHFALVSTSVKDLRITITSIDAARPGFPTNYRITYANVGTDSISGNIQLTHDNKLLFVTANPVVSNYTSPVARWDFINLPPYVSRNIDVRLNVPANVSLGTIVKTYANGNLVTADINPADNKDSVYQLVTGSYDPNDKKVFPEGGIDPTYINAGKYLDYTIRFQNTGNDTAFNITLRDTLSNNFDISSFQILSASHPYKVTLKGNGIVEWYFSNILLPDSNVNESKSHGFVRYRIKPKNTVIVGDVIKNKAAIYFDYNSPIITNETVNTVTVVTAINPVIDPIESKVFPNPAHSTLYIQTKGYFYYKVYDVSGKILASSSRVNNQTTWDVARLPKGIYFIEIRTSRGKAVHKILVH